MIFPYQKYPKKALWYEQNATFYKKRQEKLS
jgi:hypothetical protein